MPSPAISSGLSYIGGHYYFDEKIEVNSTVTTFATVRANFAPTIKTRAWAGFGQASYAFTDQLSFTAGLRYTHERKSFVQRALQSNAITGVPLANFPRGYQSEHVYKAGTPKFSIEFRPDDDVLLDASATKGFKSGGQFFEPEHGAGFRSCLARGALCKLHDRAAARKHRLRCLGQHAQPCT